MNNEEAVSRKEALEQVKYHVASGWEVVAETPQHFFLKRNTATPTGHILVLWFFWWTLGLGNIIYWLICKQSKTILK